ncbi:hypothetical protein B0H14DRAFT_3875956 [Mycena olivaceomarginata]|nr:hypothetical protein B0H14DRAFT_3875956 [Mycena olivaceomarginata]
MQGGQGAFRAQARHAKLSSVAYVPSGRFEEGGARPVQLRGRAHSLCEAAVAAPAARARAPSSTFRSFSDDECECIPVVSDTFRRRNLATIVASACCLSSFILLLTPPPSFVPMRLVPMASHPVAPIPVVLRGGRARAYLYSSHRVPAPFFARRRSLRPILLVHVDAGTLVYTIFAARHSQSVSPRTTNLRALSHAAPLPPLPARLRSLTSPIASLCSSDCLPPPVPSLESISSTSLTYVRISPSLHLLVTFVPSSLLRRLVLRFFSICHAADLDLENSPFFHILHFPLVTTSCSDFALPFRFRCTSHASSTSPPSLPLVTSTRIRYSLRSEFPLFRPSLSQLPPPPSQRLSLLTVHSIYIPSSSCAALCACPIICRRHLLALRPSFMRASWRTPDPHVCDVFLLVSHALIVLTVASYLSSSSSSTPFLIHQSNQPI